MPKSTAAGASVATSTSGSAYPNTKSYPIPTSFPTSLPTSIPTSFAIPTSILTAIFPDEVPTCQTCLAQSRNITGCFNVTDNTEETKAIISTILENGLAESGLFPNANATGDISLPEIIEPIAKCVCTPTFLDTYSTCFDCFKQSGLLKNRSATSQGDDIKTACGIIKQLSTNTSTPTITPLSTFSPPSSAPRTSLSLKKVLVAGLMIAALLAGNL
ncbi:431_t:CDS:1 [Ambispora leptoticha]|uniref:431_t:CDS:1 n=1 Tax=Ambispora leptoticha TaxID=144679 RepID=A0A9N8Z5H7_9GLOM|nr:431_t:CDS:1 [Ambispora leptoticha]